MWLRQQRTALICLNLTAHAADIVGPFAPMSQTMRSFPNAQPKPIDLVVVSYAASQDADRPLAAPSRAGFGPADLTVLRRAGAIGDQPALAACPLASTHRWAMSSAGLGLLWAAFTCAAALLLRAGSPA